MNTQATAPDRIINGVPYIRTFAAEIERGDINAFGETATGIEIVGDGHICVTWNYTTSERIARDSTRLVIEKPTVPVYPAAVQALYAGEAYALYIEKSTREHVAKGHYTHEHAMGQSLGGILVGNDGE